MSITLFIYDDTPSEIVLFEQALNMMGIPAEVQSAVSPKGCLRYIDQLSTAPQDQYPRLMFMDRNHNQPHLDGISLMNHLRTYPQLSDIPMILWYNGWSGDLLDWDPAWGTGTSMLKPQSYDGLVKGLQEILSQYKVFSFSQS